MEKLKSVRAGNRSAVTRLFRKFEEAKQSEQYDREDLNTAFENLTRKKKFLEEINEQILEVTDAQDAENEIVETDEYSNNFDTKLRHFRNFLQSIQDPARLAATLSSYQVLNVESPPFIPANVEKETRFQGPSYSVPPQAHSFASDSHHATPQVSARNHRLPKLTLPTFNGNILDWQTFWDSYESAVHLNPSLTNIEKFNYLKSLLENEALSTIAGFALTHANYLEAVNVLNERYGKGHKITEAYLQALLEIPPPKNSLSSLRTFYDKCEAYVRGLESLGQPESTYGTLLVPIIMKKLPPEIRQHLAREHGPTSWNLKDLRKSILNEIQIMEAGQITDLDSFNGEFPTTSTFHTGAKSQRKYTTYNANRKPPRNVSAKPCVFCKESHAPATCTKVTDAKTRMSIVKRSNLCFNCLGNHHANECKSKHTCRHCSKRHHSSLCNGQTSNSATRTTSHENAAAEKKKPSGNVTEKQSPPEQPAAVNMVSNNDNEKDDAAILHSKHTRSGVLLKTAITPVWSDNTCTETNILFDEGAQRSFVSDELAKKLNLKTECRETIQLSAFGKDNTSARELRKSTVYVETEDRRKIPIEVLIVPTIAVPLQNHIRYVNRNSDYLKGIKLAHPVTEDDMFEISLLIGADFYWEFVEDIVIRGNGPIAVKSKLGYLLSGPLQPGKVRSNTTSSIFNVLVSHKVEECDLEKFWKLESLGIETPEKHDNENQYLKNYQESAIEFRGNKYIAKLPWKPDYEELPSNYNVTKRRTESVINRLRKDQDLLQKYGDILQEQERRGFIEKVDESEPTNNKVHYIPHHPVVKKESSTTPIRIVYDCSCRMSPEHSSLNDSLMNTPPALNDLSKILVRFRLHRYAITTDIEKAFLHVGLSEEDRDVTRFLWLSDPSDPDSPLITYRFKAVLFGATCSPFILNATLLKHLQQNDSKTSKLLERDLYVDNILTSIQTEEEAVNYFKEARNLMNKAGFNLRSWTSNCQQVRVLAEAENVLDTEENTKILGMKWNTETDELSYQKKDQTSSQLVTKREILKISSAIYDPLGFLSPITVRAKMLLQELWRRGLDWDIPLEEELSKSWMDIKTDVENATQTVFPRHYFAEDTISQGYKLHVFVDASTKAYGAVAYLVNGYDSALVMAKTRIAPLKELTLPQLELMAAVIGARLVNHLRSTLDCDTITLWSDSQIVLHWLKSTKTLKRFIANRVKEIRDLTHGMDWKYCPTDCNPADLLTRGITMEQYKASTLWRKGPHWITDESQYPDTIQMEKSATILFTEDGESKTEKDNSISQSGIHNLIDIEKYSTYRKLLRITSHVQRFIDNCRVERNLRNIGNLKPSELQKSAELWIRNCQENTFTEEYQALKSKTTIRSNLPRIRQLRLFLDEKDILRCGGRIHNAPLSETAKFPYLLPTNHHLSKLIVMDAHERVFHSGVNSTISQLRQTYWIPSIRQLVRKILKKCVICRKVIGLPYTAPDPPPLPKIRLQEAPPFSATGIDFSGALHVKDKNNVLCKAYICLFTCAATRAVHLEVVTNLTVETFLQAFRRFCSRKSIPRIVMSDNACTFISASEEIRQLCNSETLRETLSTQGIEWQFITKRAPWFGGWWERLIGLTKTCLKKILGKALVDLETLQTVVTEIESILNDRPLTYTSSDPEDLEPLTPAHLLYGRRINTLPYPQTSEIDMSDVTTIRKENITKRAERQSLLLQQFWNRWKTEYVTSLREFHTKTGDNSTKIRIGDMVQIHDEKHRILWKTGIVEDLIKGKDGLVRSAIIRTKTGTTSRPIVKLYPLEVCTESGSAEEESQPEDTEEAESQPEEETATRGRTLPHREAAQQAKEKIYQWTH